jgi:glycosyltransferase involved in cell wall biosynthesis
MKILWVKPGKLLPLDTGGKLRSYNILRHLASDHEVTYFSYYGGTRDPLYEQGIRQHLPGAMPVWVDNLDATGTNRYVDYIRSLPQLAPYAVSRFNSPQVQRILQDCISRQPFDVAICDFLASVPTFPRKLPIPTVLFQHNVETVIWKRRVQFAPNWITRTVNRIEYAKMHHYERAQLPRFDRVFAVSELDRQAMSSVVDASRITVIPTGVDLATYHYNVALRPVGPLVMFAGSMDWEPNIDGVEYFCHNIWPKVLTEVPEARFRIVGRKPHARVKSLASATVEVTGTVPSIVDHLREAAVLVIPLRIGGGTRIKIYEGMALGKATVSTFVGSEGLDVHHGHDILLADDPRQFADHIIRLLRSDDLRRKYEAAAVETARLYDWSLIAQCFAKELQKIVAAVSRQTPSYTV